jgi:DNA-binding CsgD family transcriptional regulator
MGPVKAQVLSLMASGVTCTKDIAAVLGIPPKRVNGHISEMIREGGFSSRGDLAVAAARFVMRACPAKTRELGGKIIPGEVFPG